MQSSIVFSKGMYKDADKSMQPQGTYYDSINGRIIDLGSGNFAWEQMEGNTFNFTPLGNYYPIGGTSIRECLILLCKKTTVVYGGSTSQFDITLTGGTTYRYTWDTTGTNPIINSTTCPVGQIMNIQGQNFAAGNKGTFSITASGPNWFEVTNAAGVAENNKTIGTGYINDAPVVFGDNTTQFTITNPATYSFTYTFSGGTNPNINTNTIPIGTWLAILPEVNSGAGNFLPENTGYFQVTASAAGSFTIWNYNGTVDAACTIGTGSIATFFEDRIHELLFGTDGTLTSQVVKYREQMNFSKTYQIEAVGYYENSLYRNVYWNDYLNPPRSFPLGTVGSTGYLTMPVDLLDSSPTTHLPRYIMVSTFNGGQFYCGTYFFAYRYITSSGGSTDWNFISRPIHVAKDDSTGTLTAYQELQGDNYTILTTRGITITLSDLDPDFIGSTFQLCCFRSTDYNVSDPGIIMEERTLVAGDYPEFDVVLYGNENLGSITIEQVGVVNITVLRAKTNDSIRGRYAIANIEEQGDIVADLGTITAEESFVEIPIDMGGGAIASTWVAGTKGVFGLDTVTDPFAVFPNMYYKVAGGTVAYPSGSINHYTTGSYFLGIDGAIATKGTCSVVAGAPTISPSYIYRHYTGGSGVHVNIYADLTGFCDWKNEYVDTFLRGYWRGEKYRFGLLPYDLKGRRMNVKWLIDYTFENINPTNVPDANGQLTHRYFNLGAPDTARRHTALSKGIVIKDIDLTDYFDFDLVSDPLKLNPIPKISKIEIVRCPRIKKKYCEGILMSAVQSSTATRVSPTILFQDDPVAAGTHWPEFYFFYSPELLFERNYTPFGGAEKVRFLQKLQLEGHDGRWPEGAFPVCYDESSYNVVTRNGHIAGKFYIPDELPAYPVDTINGVPLVNRMTARVDALSVAGVAEVIPWSNYTLFNYNNDVLVMGKAGRGGNAELIELVNPGAINYTQRFAPAGKASARVTYVALENAGEADYGNIENSLYIPTGWQLDINYYSMSRLNDGAGNMKILRAFVMGGDTYVGIMDSTVAYQDVNAIDSMGFSLYFPVQTTVNMYMREGIHPGRDRGYSSINNTTGLHVDSVLPDQNVLEDFNYLDAYSSEDIGINAAGEPSIPNLPKVIDYRCRYTDKKEEGDEIDSWRIFKPLNKLDVDQKFGGITNIREKKNRLFFLQLDAVGYIPVEERELQTTSITALALGTGAAFARWDYTYQGLGNQHQWSLCDIGDGLIWFDNRRKHVVRMADTGQITEESIIKGLRNELFYGVPDTIADTPLSLNGISLGYDIKHKEVHLNFFNNAYSKTWIFNKIVDGFISQSYQRGTAHYNNGNRLYSCAQTVQQRFFIHSDPAQYLCKFYDITTPYLSALSFIENQSFVTDKVYDNIELHTFNNVPSYITYSNSYQSAIDYLTGYPDVTGALTNPYYKLRNRILKGSIPLYNNTTKVGAIGKERFRDSYLETQLTVNNTRYVTAGVYDPTINKFRVLSANIMLRKTF